MRLPGVQFAVGLLAVFMLVLTGCGSSEDSPSGQATRDPLSPTDQASAQLTEQQAKDLEVICSKGEAVPGVSACPEAVRKLMMQAMFKCTDRTHFCIKVASLALTSLAPPNGDTTVPGTALVTVSCPADQSLCSEVVPVLADGKVLKESARSLTEPGAGTSTSPPETTDPAPTTEPGQATTEPPPTDSSPAS
jgi:hypothetical protein